MHYLLAAGTISSEEVYEIEGYLAQRGVEVRVIPHLGITDPVTMVDEVWDGNTYTFRLRCIGNKPLPEDVLSVIEHRLRKDSPVTRNGMSFQLTFPVHYTGAIAGSISAGVTAIVMYTLGYLGTYSYVK